MITYLKSNKKKELCKECHKNVQRSLGLCMSCYQKDYKRRNPDKLKERKQRYYNDNKEKIKILAKKSKERNVDTIKKYHKRYYKEKKDKIIKYQKEYREKDPDKSREINNRSYQKHRDRALKYHYNKMKTDQFYNFKHHIRQRQRKNFLLSGNEKECTICGEIKNVKELQLHHLDWHTPDRYVVLCIPCHRREHKRLKEEKC